MSPALPYCSVYSFPLAIRSLTELSLLWLLGSSSLVATFPVCCVFKKDGEPLLSVTALLAVLIWCEAEAVPSQMGLGEGGSQWDPCHNLFTFTCESKALVWGSCPKPEGW